MKEELAAQYKSEIRMLKDETESAIQNAQACVTKVELEQTKAASEREAFRCELRSELVSIQELNVVSTPVMSKEVLDCLAEAAHANMEAAAQVVVPVQAQLD